MRKENRTSDAMELNEELMSLGRVLRASWVRVCEGRVDQTRFTTSLWRVLPGWRGLGAPICCLPVAGNGLRRPPLRS